MRKNKQTWSVKTLVFLALLVAIQLVLSRVLVIDLGVYRITCLLYTSPSQRDS